MSLDIDDLNSLDRDFETKKVHIRIQQRNGKKCWTIVEDLPENIDIKDFIKNIKNTCNSGGSIVDKEKRILQFNGDHRMTIKNILVDKKICLLENIVIHGT